MKLRSCVQDLCRPWPAVILAMSLALGCGGGVGTGGTGTFASGPITGYGSIIVNDVRYDDSSATVLDDDGSAHSNAELKLGMTVEVDSGALRSDAGTTLGTATRIRFVSELLGPAQAIDVAAGTLTVLDQRVLLGRDTVLDERLANGLASLAPGRVVEVYALHDPALGRLRATRIELRDGVTEFRLRGLLESTDAAAQELRIGGVRFAYAGASAIPADLSAGRFVRLRLRSQVDTFGRWLVISFGTALRAPENLDSVKLKGNITAFTSSASFSLNGLPVDASTAAFPDGTGGLKLGARVQAEGASVNGLLRAARVSVESEERISAREYELNGALASVDRTGQRFVLRATTVYTTRSDLRLDGGTLADLLPNRQVEVKALLSADGARLEATRIKFK